MSDGKKEAKDAAEKTEEKAKSAADKAEKEAKKAGDKISKEAKKAGDKISKEAKAAKIKSAEWYEQVKEVVLRPGVAGGLAGACKCCFYGFYGFRYALLMGGRLGKMERETRMAELWRLAIFPKRANRFTGRLRDALHDAHYERWRERDSVESTLGRNHRMILSCTPCPA